MGKYIIKKASFTFEKHHIPMSNSYRTANVYWEAKDKGDGKKYSVSVTISNNSGGDYRVNQNPNITNSLRLVDMVVKNYSAEDY